jgi:hypothetical protein
MAMAFWSGSDIIPAMNQDEIISQLMQAPEALALAAAGLAIVLILLVNRKRLQLRLREWRIQRSLQRIGCDQIRNLICPDGLDGYYTIDRLALVKDAILLIAYKPYGGNIYCAERISEWTQVIGKKSFKFENPLFELENQMTALKSLAGGTPLHGFLFFNYSAEFPKGHPDVVLHPDNIPERFSGANCEPVNPQIRSAWELLKARHESPSDNQRASAKT